MYDPKIARFLQEDTYTGDPNDPLSLNLYTYCHNEPIMYTDPTGHEYQLIKANGREYTLEEYAKEQELFRELGRLIDRMENGDKSVSAKDVSKAGGTGFAESLSCPKLLELRGSISNHVDAIKDCESTIRYYTDKLSTATNQKDIDNCKAEITKAYNDYQSQASYLQSNWGIEVNGFNVVKNEAYYQSVATVYRYGDQNNSVYKDNIAFDFSNTMLALGEMGIAIKGNGILNKSKTSTGDSNKSTNNTEKTAGLGNFLKGLKDKVKGLFGGGDKGTSKSQVVTNNEVGNSFDTYVEGTKLKGIADQGLLETQESYTVKGLGQKSVKPDYSIYDTNGNLSAIGDAKSGAIVYDDQAKGFIQVAANETTSKTIIYYTPLGNTTIPSSLLNAAEKAGVRIIQIGVK